MEPLFTNDAVVFGLLTLVLGLIFYTSKLASWQKFYGIVPTLVLCYFVPAILYWPLGLIAPEWFDPSLAQYLSEKGLALPESGMSFGQIKEWLDASGIPERGYGQFLKGGEYYTSGLEKFLKKDFEIVPPEGLSYEQMEAWLKSNGIPIDGYGQFTRKSKLYFMASRYLLPASLLLLCINIDFKGIIRLGPKALIMFLTATVGIVLGGPIALLIVSYLMPGVIGVEPAELAGGLSTIAGSWIGGGANQAAMKEVFDVNDSLFGTMVIVDVLVANIWMAFLLVGAGKSDKIDRFFKADSSAITDLKNRIAAYRASIERMPNTRHMFLIMAVAFFGVALSHMVSDAVVPWLSQNYAEALSDWKLDSLMSGFFWIVVVSTTVGLLLSFTPARKLEGVGASNWGSLFIYVLVATIGMKMNVGEILDNLGLFAIGIIWMLVHVGLLLLVAKIIKAPFFFVAVGSQANVGGAASAPIVASAFNPVLAPVGALLAVLGYAMGTYFAYICGLIMEMIAG